MMQRYADYSIGQYITPAGSNVEGEEFYADEEKQRLGVMAVKNRSVYEVLLMRIFYSYDLHAVFRLTSWIK